MLKIYIIFNPVWNFYFFFIREHFLRYATKFADRYEPFWYFLPLIPAGLMPWTGFFFALFTIAISACETAVAIAIVINIYRNLGHVEVDSLNELQEPVEPSENTEVLK